jgi:hypothetical protein
VQSWLIANGIRRSITTAGRFQLLTIDVRASATGDADVKLRRVQSFVNSVRNINWDDAHRDPLAAAPTLEGRIVTSALADADARQQLNSKLAFVEESEDEGDSWDVLVCGYVNRVALADALLWEFTVGESRRVEQSKKVFDRISDPIEHPL